MNETKKLKFPVASIFTALLALGLIDNLRYLLLRAGTLDRMIGYRMVVEFDSTHSVPHILYQMLLIGSMLLLTVLLFMRKRNGLLSGALAMQALLPVFTLVSSTVAPGAFLKPMSMSCTLARRCGQSASAAAMCWKFYAICSLSS